MTAGGLEVPITKAATAAVSRMAGPAWHRYTRSRNVKRAGALLDFSQVVLPELTPAEADCVAGYVASHDFHVIATQLALSALETQSRRAVTVPDATITEQVIRGLRARGEWEPGTLRQVADLLKQDLGRVVSQTLQQVADAGASAGQLATAVENAGDQATAAMRNSALLQGISDLGAIHLFQQDLRDQIRALSKMRVPNAGAVRFVAFDTLYVEPTLELSQDASPMEAVSGQERFARSSGITDEVPVPGRELLEVVGRAVILGDPGGGKSTLAAKTVHDLASDTAGPVPLLLILRDYIEEFRAGKSTIAEHLAGLCRSPYQVEPPLDALEYLLLNGRAVVIFDGLDEVFEPGVRARVIEAIHGFAHRYPNTPILVTSRKVGYYEAPLDAALFPAAELQEFSTDQVAEYARKWFALEQPLLAEKFLADSELVADLRTNPLMLSLMCGLYRAEGYIPANRPDVYEKCALLLFEGWDKQRDIRVPLPFDAHVQEAIQSLAWWLYTEPSQHAVLTRAKLQDFMTEFLHKERFRNRADAANAAVSFIDFCTGRAWVLSKVGTSGEEEVFGFTHRTFLEYFAAIYLTRMYADGTRLFEQLQEHLQRAEWEVVGQLALQALKKNVANGTNDFLTALLNAAENSDLNDRSNLLAFAARSLAFVVPNPMVVDRMVGAVVTFFLDMPDADGIPQIRYLVEPNALTLYDEAFVALRAAGGELKGDIELAVIECCAAALDREPPSANVLLVCEHPDAFLGIMGLPATAEAKERLDRKYRDKLADRPFVVHDARCVIRGTLPVKDLLERYGPGALYPMALIPQKQRSWSLDYSVYARVANRSMANLDETAKELAQLLPSRPAPWLGDRAVLRGYKLFGLDHEDEDAVNHGYYFAAILLLALPLIEYLTNEDVWPRMPRALGTVAELCLNARQGQGRGDYIRDALRSRAVPSAVTDFVVRWANNEFSLLGTD